MIAYFTASIVGKRYYLKNDLAIIDHLKSNKITVISDQIIKTTEPEVHSEKKELRLKYHAQVEKWIKSCDFMVVEASFPSISVGYEISWALTYGKPVLILYAEGEAPSLFAYHKNENILCEKYTLDILPDLLDDFADFAEGAGDTRFTFYMSHEQTKYLDKKSIDRKVPKSVYLRRLIDEDMKLKS